MKVLILLLVLSTCIKVSAQNVPDTAKFEFYNDASQKKSRDYRLIERNDEKSPYKGLIPEIIILLNYERVITMDQYQIVKGNGDIIKQYTIQNKELIGEVKQVMIVETKNKDRYRLKKK